jgi:hypothetical protein
MMRLVGLFGALLMAGCSPNPDEWVCSKPLSILAVAGNTGADSLARADSCVHRWAYRLAPSKETLKDVAAAVVSGCSAPISEVATEFKPNGAGGDSNAGSVQETLRKYDGLARFHVIQARVGHCKAQ